MIGSQTTSLRRVCCGLVYYECYEGTVIPSPHSLIFRCLERKIRGALRSATRAIQDDRGSDDFWHCVPCPLPNSATAVGTSRFKITKYLGKLLDESL